MWNYGISLVCLRICFFDYFDFVEVEEPNPEGGVAIRRKGWLAVCFKIKIKKQGSKEDLSLPGRKGREKAVMHREEIILGGFREVEYP